MCTGHFIPSTQRLCLPSAGDPGDNGSGASACSHNELIGLDNPAEPTFKTEDLIPVQVHVQLTNDLATGSTSRWSALRQTDLPICLSDPWIIRGLV